MTASDDDALPSVQPGSAGVLTRRTLFAASALLMAGAGQATAAPASRRPNILFALADDWSWTSASTRDDLSLAIPTFRRVCREGVSFSNAFVASPSCSASRAAILTGQWPWRLEDAANLAGTFDARFAVYPDLLEKSGYHVGVTRKGWGPGQIAPGHRTRNPAGPAYPDFARFLSARPAGAPFCFWFGTRDPHRPYEINRGDGAHLDPAALTVPPYLPDVPDVRGDMNDYKFGVERFDREVGEMLRQLEQAGELDNTVVVMTGDNGWPFPRGKATLYDSGTHVPLGVRWHGVARPGRSVDAIVSLTDIAPTFLQLAGVAVPAEMTGRSLLPFLQHPDESAATRDHVLTGMERHMDCRVVKGQGYPMRALRTARFLFIRNFEPSRAPAGDPSIHPHTQEEFVTNIYAGYGDIDQGRSKAFIIANKDDPAVRPFFERAAGPRPPRELYAVGGDPYEMRNLIGDPAYATVAADMDARLMAELRASGDPRATGHGSVFDSYPTYNDPGFKRPDVI
jgi:N-sulfoglucosamine sulfohydrolase